MMEVSINVFIIPMNNDASTSRMEGTPMEKIACPGCGAPTPAEARKCPYCEYDIGKTSSKHAALIAQGKPYLVAIQFGIIALVSAAGWLFEDRGSFWSADTSCAIWLGGVPSVACLIGILTAEGRAIALRAIVFFLAGGLPLLFGVAIVIGHLNDDAFGLSAGIGACASVGFLLGRILRKMGKAG